MKTEMKVLLYLKRNEQSEKDMCPLMGRISIKGRYNSTAQFSCKMKVDSKIWNATSQRCTGKSKVATSTNREIEKLLLLLRYRFNEFLEDGQKFSAEDLKNAFQGIAAVQMTLLKLFKSHNEELALCVGVNRTQNTYLLYDKVYRGLEKYIHSKKKVFPWIYLLIIKRFTLLPLSLSVHTLQPHALPLPRLLQCLALCLPARLSAVPSRPPQTFGP